MIRIITVDDHVLIREGLKRLVDQESDMLLVGEAANAGQLYRLLENNPCDVLILDLNLPDINGFDVLETLRKQRPGLRVMVLSMLPEDPYSRKALDAGAIAYLTKGTESEIIIQTLRRIA